MSFGVAAARLCGLAARALGWTPADFWASTPTELAACLGIEGEELPGASPEMLAELLRRFPDEGTTDG